MTEAPDTPTDSVKDVGMRLHEERLRLQLTQVALAERLGISRTSATLYEAGKHLPRAEVLISLDRIGVDVLYILTGRRAGPDVVDLEVMAFAMEEVRRQTSQSAEELSYRECLSRAWPIYTALLSFRHRSSGVMSTAP